MKSWIHCLFLSLCSCLMYAQQAVVFIDNTGRLESIRSSDYSLAISDVNGDYRDDIIRTTEDSIIISCYTANDGLFRDLTIMNKAFPVLSTNIADLDNDYVNEILLTGNRTGISVLEFDYDELSHEVVFQLESDHYAQGSAVADMNGDASLDYFVSNDNGHNKCFFNSGQGLLMDSIVSSINVLSPRDSEGNYNAIFIDADTDGDLDLYVTKCHINANSFEDPRRINQFFINNNGTFNEAAANWGLDHGDQSWCSSAADFDNDGDVDIFLLNHGSPMMILENTGTGFQTNLMFSGAELIGDDQQVICGDFNNDSWIDILILGFDDRLLLNKGNLQFEVNNNPFGFQNAYSAACGDLNNDGWLDIYAVFGVAGSTVPDRLFYNFPINDKHHVRFSLAGTDSNAQGIGARMLIYGDWGVQTRWMNSGESYGITNSMNMHFGLGDFDVIDSLICYWPSGIVDKYHSLNADRHYMLTENTCLEELASLDHEGVDISCVSNPLILKGDSDVSWIWNTGDTADTVRVDQSGFYFARSADLCKNATDWIEVEVLDLPEVPGLIGPDSIMICEDSQYTLFSTLNESHWPDGSISNFFEIDRSGIFECFTTNSCDTLYSGSMKISWIKPEAEDKFVQIKKGEDLVLDGSTENLIWFNDEFSEIGQGRFLTIENIQGDTTFYFQKYEFEVLPAYNIGPFSDEHETYQYGQTDQNHLFEFEVFESLTLQSFNVHTDRSGIRAFVLLNSSMDTIHQVDRLLIPGRNMIDLDFELLPGKYFFGTLDSMNMQQLGYVSPRLGSPENWDFGFPLQLTDKIVLLGDGTGDNNFIFFDWIIKEIPKSCYSEIVEYVVNVDTTSSTGHEIFGEIQLIPNPASSFIRVSKPSGFYNVNIYDLNGRRQLNKKAWDGNNINIEILDAGSYIVELKKEGYSFFQKLIISQ